MTIKIASALVSAALGVGALFGFIATVSTTTHDAWVSRAEVTYDLPDELVIVRLNP